MFFFQKFDETAGTNAQQFATAYRAAYNEEPATYSARAYDGLYLFADHMTECKNNGSCYKAKLDSLAGYQGASGTILFDEYGDLPSAEFEVLALENNKLVRK